MIGRKLIQLSLICNPYQHDGEVDAGTRDDKAGGSNSEINGSGVDAKEDNKNENVRDP